MDIKRGGNLIANQDRLVKTASTWRALSIERQDATRRTHQSKLSNQ